MRCEVAIATFRRVTCGCTSVSSSGRKSISFKCAGRAARLIKLRTWASTGSSPSRKVRVRSPKKSSSRDLRSGFMLKTLSTVLLTLAICFQAVGQDGDLLQNLERVAALIRDNRMAEAERQLASISRTAPNSPDVLNLLGTIRAKQNRLNEAESLFLQVLKIEENFTPARMNLSYLYVLKRAPDRAIFELKEVLRLDPNNAQALQKLPELLLSQGKFDECIAFIEKLRGVGPVSPDMLVMLGDAYVAKGALTEAEPPYLLALDNRLDNAGALLGLAQISRSKGELRETTIYLTRVATLSADSNSPEFLYKFAVLAMRVGMVDQAKAALER